MKKGSATLLLVCALLLLTNIALAAQQDPASSDREKQAAAEAQEREKRAAIRAEAEKKRADARALVREKRAAFKAEAEKKRTAAKALAREKQAVARAKQAISRAEAQEKRVAARAKRDIVEAMRRSMPRDGTFRLLGSRPNFNTASVVTGAPYSATAITEHVQTLSDGNQIIQKNEATYYRDREGRIRIDQRLKTIGKWTADGDPPRMVTIWDPVASRFYSLDPRKQMALINSFEPKKKSAVLSGPKTSAVSTGPSGPPKSTPKKETSDQHAVIADGSGRRKKESLGQKMIEGVSAEGTRVTRIIPAGEIGNVRPIEIVDESWYSSELQMPVMTRHHDPRSGDTIYRLTNINRNDPDRSLFEIPAGYQIVDKTAPKVRAQPKPKPEAKPAKNTEVIL